MRQATTLTRRQVARQEIETAIELIFGQGSSVCANLLAWAAVDVLRGVARAQGVETYFDRMETIVRPDRLVEFRRLLRDHYTFSKHADRDPNRVVENFSGESVNFVLLGATEDYQAIYGQHTLPMMLFKTWFLKHNPHILTLEGQNLIRQAAEALQIGSLSEARALMALARNEGASLVSHLPRDLQARIEI